MGVVESSPPEGQLNASSCGLAGRRSSLLIQALKESCVRGKPETDCAIDSSSHLSAMLVSIIGSQIWNLAFFESIDNEDRGGCGPHSGSKEPVLALGAKTGSQSAKVSDAADVTAHAEEPPQAFNETKVAWISRRERLG